MFFILSKVLYYLIMPFSIVTFLMIGSAVVKRPIWKKRLFLSALVLLLFFSNEFIANEVMAAWEVDPVPYGELADYKLGIVLTGATIPNLEPDDRVYFHRGADRVLHTVQLYKQGLIEKILISGGSGSLVNADEPEANKFQKTMLLMGVPEGDILIENATRNTAESAIEVSKILNRLGYRPEECLLITSAFHMRRSLAAYRKSGLTLDAFSTDFYARPAKYYPDVLFVPQIEAMEKWHKLSKEWFGMLAYKIVGYI